MNIKVLNDFKLEKDHLVSVKQMNHIFELCYLQKRNTKISIKLLDKNHYVDLKTGEVLDCTHITDRSQNTLQISQSLKRLRDYINTNVVDVDNCKWITLTYAENMTDTKRLYIDFKNFVKRFKYKFGHIEYIVACEPQGRGAWHLHCIFIFDNKAPYIHNKIIQDLWGNGFTKTNKLDNIDNIGAYLTAYLGDMSLSDTIKYKIKYKDESIKIVDEIGNKKLKTPKKFVKGARLSMYPPKFNIYRISRGIKKPVKKYFSYHVVKEKVGLGEPTYKKAIELIDSNKNFSNTVVYEYYNTKRR